MNAGVSIVARYLETPSSPRLLARVMISAATSDIPDDLPDLVTHYNSDSDYSDDDKESVSDGVHRSRRGRSRSNTAPAADEESGHHTRHSRRGRSQSNSAPARTRSNTTNGKSLLFCYVSLPHVILTFAF